MYRVTNTATINIRRLERVDDVITAASSAGATQIYDLSFGMDDKQYNLLKALAREKAVVNAATVNSSPALSHAEILRCSSLLSIAQKPGVLSLTHSLLGQAPDA